MMPELKDKLIERIQQLSKELESHINDREHYMASMRRLDTRIKDISVIIPELQKLIDSEEE